MSCTTLHTKMETKVVDILKKTGDKGMSITELVSKSKLSRSSIRISLARLEGAGRVTIRKVGMAKLYHLNPKNSTKK